MSFTNNDAHFEEAIESAHMHSTNDHYGFEGTEALEAPNTDAGATTFVSRGSHGEPRSRLPPVSHP